MKYRIMVFLVVFLLSPGMAGCSRENYPIVPDPVAQAAAEATALIQNAQATVIIAKARAQATGMAIDAVVTPSASATISETVERITIEGEHDVSETPNGTPEVRRIPHNPWEHPSWL